MRCIKYWRPPGPRALTESCVVSHLFGVHVEFFPPHRHMPTLLECFAADIAERKRYLHSFPSLTPVCSNTVRHTQQVRLWPALRAVLQTFHLHHGLSQLLSQPLDLQQQSSFSPPDLLQLRSLLWAQISRDWSEENDYFLITATRLLMTMITTTFVTL